MVRLPLALLLKTSKLCLIQVPPICGYRARNAHCSMWLVVSWIDSIMHEQHKIKSAVSL